MEPKLTKSQQRIYDALFRHPIAHNLQWRDVRSMLLALADVAQEPNGNLKISRNGASLFLHPQRTKDVAEAEDLLRIRRFLEQPTQRIHPSNGDGVHLLVVIDHRQARIYQTEHQGSVPQRIVPYDPDGFGRNLHYVQDDSNGQRKPESKRFYDAVAKTLRGAEKILLFGSSTGASCAMEQLRAQLKHNHKDLEARIIGTLVVDETHLTEDQLLQKAREFYEDNLANT